LKAGWSASWVATTAEKMVASTVCSMAARWAASTAGKLAARKVCGRVARWASTVATWAVLTAPLSERMTVAWTACGRAVPLGVRKDAW
jgi:hypothetical protein